MKHGVPKRKIDRRKTRRVLSLLLTAVLVFNMGTTSVLADAETDGNTKTALSADGLCEHHTGHDRNLCGYVEAVEKQNCTHMHDENCYSNVVVERAASDAEAEGDEEKVLDCPHVHDENCGYAEAVKGAPCTFVCEVCRPQEGETEEEGKEEKEELDEEKAELRDRLNSLKDARRRSIKLPKIKQKSLNSIAYNSANAVEQSISGDYLLIVNNSDSAIETGDLTGLSATVPESRTKRPKPPKGLHRIDYHVPSTVGQNYSMKSVEALEVINYEEPYIFLIEDKVDSGYLYPFVAEAKAVGDNVVVWTHAGLIEKEVLHSSWAPFFDFKSQETNTLSYKQAEEIAAEFDSNYEEMVYNFGEFLNMDQSGKVSLVCYDIQDGYKPSGDDGYIGGFFAGYDFLLNEDGYPIYNGMQMLHIDTYPAMSTDGTENDLGDISRAYSTLFHEFQHMINFSIGYQYGHLNTSDGNYYNSQDTFINEMLSMSAEQMLGYAQDDRIKYYNDFNPAIGFSLTQWDEDLMNYSLSYLLSQYLWSQKGGNDVFYNIANSGYYGAEAIETAFETQYNEADSPLIDMSFEKMHTSYRSALALNEESGLNSFAGSYVEGKELKQHLYTGDGPVYVPPYGSILIKLAEKDITVSVPEGLEYYGLTGEQVIENYTLTFDSKGGTAVSSITVEGGSIAAKPADPTKEGFTFEGWFTSPDGGETLDATSFDFTSPITADSTLYAKWSEQPIINYIVTFDSKGGTAVSPLTVKEGTAAAKPAAPTKAGFTFEGWFTSPDGGETLAPTSFDFTSLITADSTLYAKWSEQPIINYIVTYDSKGGTAVSPLTVKEGTAAAKPADPTKAGFTFEGWFTSSDEGVTLDATSFDFTSPITADSRLYAKWSALPIVSHTITASAGAGGSITPSGTITLAEGAGQTFTITPDSRYSISSVRVDGVSIGAVSSYTFSGVKGSHTITAAFSYNGGGGHSGGGSNSSTSGSGSNSASKSPAPKEPTKGESAIAPTMDQSGGATVSLTTDAIADAVKKATDEAGKNGTQQNGITVEINAATNQAVNSITAVISKEVQEQLIQANVSEVAVRSNNITIGLDKEVLSAIRTTADSEVSLTAVPADRTELSAEAQNAIGSRPAYELSLTYGDQRMSSFGNGRVSVAIPYKLQAGENAGNICAVYVGEDGSVAYVADSGYDTDGQSVRFTTNHFSTYGVAFRAAAPKIAFPTNPWVNAAVKTIQMIQQMAKWPQV